jgi:acyl-coenzyme A thioesterase PaaI-like protein
VQRVGRRLAFAQGRITADDKLIAQTSATFAVPSQK